MSLMYWLKFRLRYSFQPCSNQYRYLQLYLITAVLANLALVFFKGYSGDLGYWTGWLRQLERNGYEGFDGNYPPLYIHWLYLVAKLYLWLDMPIEKNNQLKLLTQIPVLVFHYLFVLMVYTRVKRFGWGSPWFHLLLSLAALSPAVLWNGPMWGQVDLVPVVILASAIYAGLSKKYSIFMVPLFTLSLLTKFQMIAFAPVIGFLFFLKPLRHIAGFALSALCIFIAFLPWIAVGEFKVAVEQAYIATLGQYPKTTFNAANLWIILTGNNAEDTRQILHLAETGILQKIGEAKYFGMLLFCIISLVVFLRGAYSVLIKKVGMDRMATISWSAALLSAMAFFTVLPAMHERYMFPAVVLAILLASEQPRALVFAVLISALSAANMAIILEINGSDIWFGLSTLVVVVFVAVLVMYVVGDRMTSIAYAVIWNRVFAFRYLALISLFGGIFLSSFMVVGRYGIYEPELKDNQMFLSALRPIKAEQDHGRYYTNRSHDRNRLSINAQRYARGIGTHADSRIEFELPKGAKELQFRVGVDDEVGRADIRFVIEGDGRELWRSGVMYGHELISLEQTVNVEGIKVLALVVDSVTDDRWDHADWINLVLTVDDD